MELVIVPPIEKMNALPTVNIPGSDQDIHRAKLVVEFKYRLGKNMQLSECENVYRIMVALIDGLVKQGRGIYDRINKN